MMGDKNWKKRLSTEPLNAWRSLESCTDDKYVYIIEMHRRTLSLESNNNVIVVCGEYEKEQSTNIALCVLMYR